ncbi:MTH1187 family thiamine-binding protein [Alkaliphilus hydrothermalis]|uniref:Uncharacterized protein (TIGR00106 family) n=1 Tax=Alkaliphilus hydrothermalis TaxID=1482730 RepID=A0ABS2NQ56_9FIRM|nr:MTH1187 family thiamine-binding protein [Alkaliphilus hydrothermalis]MBM7615070.1 uncharacterized protein (TIGR00106 family) [Alkaliphilus hydrothermalis]
MAIVEVSVVPIGTGSTSVSEYVAACHRVLKEETRINYQLTPMATILEGDLDLLLEVVRKLHEVPYGKGAERVYTTIRIDDRRDKDTSMERKVQAVESKL